jgi:hypothetical protein
MVFKILILQALYNLSDQAMEFQILDRYCFSSFLDIIQGAKFPDAKWTKKGGRSFFGYINHLSIDVEHNVILCY